MRKIENLEINQEVNKKLKALLEFSGKRDIRYYLNGVCFDLTNGILRGAATDGHVIAVTILATGVFSDDLQVIAPNEFIKHITATKSEYTLTVDGEVGRHKLTASHGFTSTGIDGRYPDWRRVVKLQTNEPALGHFNADYLAIIAKAVRILGNKSGLFNFSQHGDNAAYFEILGRDFCGVLMPMRGAGITPASFIAVTGVE